MTLTAAPAWTQSASCLGQAGRDVDWWVPDETLPADEIDRQTYKARTICSTCPVRLDCAVDALQTLPKTGEHAMRGGLTPNELAGVARSLGLPWRRSAQCGSRSKYVAGCHCPDCRNAHRIYEHERRLHTKTEKQ